ncbi:MAG TPA: ribosome assembly RNA-binding protein YhbY [Gemmatimonadaceae bacterium]
MALTSKQRAELRAEAHHLTAAVHLGHQGATPAVVKSVDDALRTHELVKVQLNRAAEAKPKDVANQLAQAVHADVVQVIGRTATLYRENPEIRKKPGDLPPWRR